MSIGSSPTLVRESWRRLSTGTRPTAGSSAGSVRPLTRPTARPLRIRADLPILQPPRGQLSAWPYASERSDRAPTSEGRNLKLGAELPCIGFAVVGWRERGRDPDLEPERRLRRRQGEALRLPA